MPMRKPDLPSDPRVAVRWVRDHLSDIRLPAVRAPSIRTLELKAHDLKAPDLKASGREIAAWLSEHLPHPPSRRRGPEPSALILPAVLAAASAGAAFWWWTQWSRGRAEALAAEEGAAHPEHIMDHTPPPPSTGEAPNPSDDRLSVPAEEIMAHAPPSPQGKAKGRLKKVSPVIAPVAEQALRDSLAVQTSAQPPEPERPAAKPAA